VVRRSQCDPAAPHTFTSDDAGVYTFSGFVLVTPGDQTITLTDDGGLTGSLTVTI
jgi:hypothetical protein